MYYQDGWVVTRFLPEFADGKRVLKSTGKKTSLVSLDADFIVDNDELQSQISGLSYHRSTKLSDIDHEIGGSEFGEIVHGILLAGWLKVAHVMKDVPFDSHYAEPDESSSPTLNYTSMFSNFKPHLFQGMLQSEAGDIWFEFTPTNHAAAIRLSFDPTSHDRCLDVKIGHHGHVEAAQASIFGYTTAHSGGTPTDWRMYFVVKARASSVGVDVDKRNTTGTLRFPGALSSPITLGVATSFISLEQAWLNLDREVGENSFDALV